MQNAASSKNDQVEPVDFHHRAPVSSLMAAVQMVDLPEGGEGLAWIASHDPDQLQLIPGLQPASIAAAAAGDQQALAYLRFTAQHHAAYPSGSAMNELDRALLQASEASSKGDDCALYTAFEGLGHRAPLYEVIEAREEHTMALFAEAARQGELAAFVWMHAICIKTWTTFTQEMMPIAAKAGQLSILQYLRSGPEPEYWDSDTTAAAVPHLHCLQWLLSTDAPGGPCEYAGGILGQIAQHHGLHGVQWFCAHCEDVEDELDDGDVLVTAVKLSDRSMIQWLRAQHPPPPWHASLCRAAVECENITMLGWLRSQDPPCLWDESVTAAAASRDIKILQWLRAQEPPCLWGPSTWAAAARSGKLEILTWLRDQDPPCPWDATCAEAAASRQSLETLQWLQHNARLCEPCTTSSVIAARRGDLPMLEWLSDNGTPLTGDLYIAAAVHNQTHILNSLINRSIVLPEAPSEPIDVFFTITPMRMFLSDIKMPLHDRHRQHVNQARRACCMFHALIRWFRRAVSDPSRRAHLAFDSSAKDRSGQLLLMRLSRLPPELINKIAVAAQLQHDVLHRSLCLA